MATTIERLAAARGRRVDEVIDAARRVGLSVWDGTTPLDDAEVARVDAVLAQATAAAQAWSPPGGPPPAAPAAGAQQPWSFPPSPPQWGAPLPPPPTPPPPRASTSAGKTVAIVLASVVGAIAFLVGTMAVLGNGDDSDDDQFDDVADSIALDEDEDESEGVDEPDPSPLPPGVSDLTVGECFDDLSVPTDDPSGVVEAAYEEVDCSAPHDAEVYALSVHPDPPGTAFPGEDGVVAFADERCLEQFERFVGEPYEFSSLDILYFFPTELSWQRLDDRLIVCAVIALDGSQLTGSMEGSGA